MKVTVTKTQVQLTLGAKDLAALGDLMDVITASRVRSPVTWLLPHRHSARVFYEQLVAVVTAASHHYPSLRTRDDASALSPSYTKTLADLSGILSNIRGPGGCGKATIKAHAEPKRKRSG